MSFATRGPTQRSRSSMSVNAAGTTTSVPGLFYPSAAGYDVIGRYFTMGVRGRF